MFPLAYLDQDKIAVALKSLQNSRDLTNEEIAELLGISASYVSLLINQKRNMSQKLFHKFCEVFNYSVQTFLDEDGNKRIEIADSLTELLRMKQLELVDVSEMTGISILDLSQIQRGKLEPTEEHIKILSRALNVKPEVLEEGKILREMETIRRSLNALNINKDAIKDVMSFIEREI